MYRLCQEWGKPSAHASGGRCNELDCHSTRITVSSEEKSRGGSGVESGSAAVQLDFVAPSFGYDISLQLAAGVRPFKFRSWIFLGSAAPFHLA
jgi:hypothetical protein